MRFNPLLTASILGIISAAVSTATFANTVNTSTFCKPGFYAGLQGGASETFYHPGGLLSPARANEIANDGTVSSSTFGPVVITTPTQLGDEPVVTQYITSTAATSSSLSRAIVDSRGMGGRLYAGYQFNPYFAIEAGYTQYAKTTFHALGTSVTQFHSDGVIPPLFQPIYPITVKQDQPPYQTDTIDGTTTKYTSYNGEITENAIDLVAKATLPLQVGFGLYVKGGMAYINADRYINAHVLGSKTSAAETTVTNSSLYPPITKTTNTQIDTTNNVHNSSTIYHKTYQAFRPVAGVGVNYSIPSTNLSVNADYTRVFSYGGIPNAALLSLGLEYKFA